MFKSLHFKLQTNKRNGGQLLHCFIHDYLLFFQIHPLFSHIFNISLKNGNSLSKYQEASEGNIAKDTFGGRLTPDFIAEKLGHSTFSEVRELDLPSCAIRTVDLGVGEQFINLRRYTKYDPSENCHLMTKNCPKLDLFF